MGRGPQAEQISGGDATFRVEAEGPNGGRVIAANAELLTYSEALAKARDLASKLLGPGRDVRHIHVVNERTGFTKDTITYEPSRRLIESN